jgi:hypothetical protein
MFLGFNCRTRRVIYIVSCDGENATEDNKTEAPVLLLPYLLPLRLTVPLLLLETGTLLNPNPGSTSILTP